MTDRVSEARAYGPSLSYVAFAATALFAILTALVLGGRTAVLDRDLILSLRASARPWLTQTLLAVTFTSGRLAVPAAILFAIALYRRRGLRSASYYLGACVVAQALNAILKYAVHRVRPHDVSPRLTAAGGLAYPSADAMLAVVIFGLGTLLLARTFRACAAGRAAIGLATIFVVLAAIARVYLGAHWPSDVLGGALAGVACAAITIAAMRRPPVNPAPAALVTQKL
jgi:membrane-associated phospholipid phosphatase